MTIEEQLHTVATLLEATARIALRNEESIRKCTELQQRNVGALAEKHAILTDTLVSLARNVADYVTASNERMKQMEANLDALIRIITAEHSNRKGKL
jgi:hypothetical protein